MTNVKSYAQRELEILSKSFTDPDDRPIIEPFIPEILALCEKFGNSGQSGGSAPYTVGVISQAIKKLLLFEPICDITGLPEEWNLVSGYDGMTYQNNRCSALFKEGIDGDPHYLNAIVWKGEEEDDTFTGTVGSVTSRQYIKAFPFKPKTFYIDVVKEQLPDDWNKEPFIEGSEWYDSEEYERTGIKNWRKNKYRYRVKDPSQLERAFKYYGQH